MFAEWAALTSTAPISSQVARSAPVSTWAVNPAVHVRYADEGERQRARREKAREDLAAYFASLKTKQDETDAA